jgi:hypothetical protein
MHPVKKKQGDDAAAQNPIVLMLDKATVAKMAVPEPKNRLPNLWLFNGRKSL